MFNMCCCVCVIEYYLSWIDNFLTKIFGKIGPSDVKILVEMFLAKKLVNFIITTVTHIMYVLE